MKNIFVRNIHEERASANSVEAAAGRRSEQLIDNARALSCGA